MVGCSVSDGWVCGSGRGEGLDTRRQCHPTQSKQQRFGDAQFPAISARHSKKANYLTLPTFFENNPLASHYICWLLIHSNTALLSSLVPICGDTPISPAASNTF